MLRSLIGQTGSLMKRSLQAVAGTKKPILVTVPVGNNPARVRFLIYHKGLEDTIDIRTPGDWGGLSSPEYRAINPQGKIPAFIFPSGETLFEAKVIMGYLLDAYGDSGPPIGANTAELRAKSALLVQVHDLYIASPNSSNPQVTATQGAMYKAVDVIDGPSRAAKFAEIWKQLGVIEALLDDKGPYACGAALTEADLTLWPTLSSFLAVMLPVYGWVNPMDDADNFPKVKRWHDAIALLPAAQKVKSEVDAALEGWKEAKKFDPILEQIKKHPELKWKWP